LSHPATTSHRGQPAEMLSRLGIHAGLIRLSIGIEDVDDLIDEFLSAIAAC
jgi:cystathionine beta-lyase/cystathionine gamma-synthase